LIDGDGSLPFFKKESNTIFFSLLKLKFVGYYKENNELVKFERHENFQSFIPEDVYRNEDILKIELRLDTPYLDSKNHYRIIIIYEDNSYTKGFTESLNSYHYNFFKNFYAYYKYMANSFRDIFNKEQKLTKHNGKNQSLNDILKSNSKILKYWV